MFYKRGKMDYLLSSKKSQVWIETVIYTGVALALMGLVLSFAVPKIREMQDKTIIEKTISELEGLNNKIYNVIQGGPGNVRKEIVYVTGREGKTEERLIIDAKNNKIKFQMRTPHQYSEPGETINQGKILITTEEINGEYKISMVTNYDQYNLTYSGKNKNKALPGGATPYEVFISNKGEINNKIQINLEL